MVFLIYALVQLFFCAKPRHASQASQAKSLSQHASAFRTHFRVIPSAYLLHSARAQDQHDLVCLRALCLLWLDRSYLVFGESEACQKRVLVRDDSPGAFVPGASSLSSRPFVPFPCSPTSIHFPLLPVPLWRWCSVDAVVSQRRQHWCLVCATLGLRLRDPRNGPVVG